MAGAGLALGVEELGKCVGKRGRRIYGGFGGCRRNINLAEDWIELFFFKSHSFLSFCFEDYNPEDKPESTVHMIS